MKIATMRKSPRGGWSVFLKNHDHSIHTNIPRWQARQVVDLFNANEPERARQLVSAFYGSKDGRED